jgi:hypothetical protein
LYNYENEDGYQDGDIQSVIKDTKAVEVSLLDYNTRIFIYIKTPELITASRTIGVNIRGMPDSDDNKAARLDPLHPRQHELSLHEFWWPELSGGYRRLSEQEHNSGPLRPGIVCSDVTYHHEWLETAPGRLSDSLLRP